MALTLPLLESSFLFLIFTKCSGHSSLSLFLSVFPHYRKGRFFPRPFLFPIGVLPIFSPLNLLNFLLCTKRAATGWKSGHCTTQKRSVRLRSLPATGLILLISAKDLSIFSVALTRPTAEMADRPKPGTSSQMTGLLDWK